MAVTASSSKIEKARTVAKARRRQKVKSRTKSGVRSKPRSDLPLEKELLLRIHDLMLKSRVLEERLIKIYKSGEAYFWIGGPGEEAFGVPLGMLVKKGRGHDHDYLHLHYRATPTLVAMGMPMIDSIRLIMNKATDRCTGGRNFANHYCFPEWNVTPVTSPIETQYVIAIGTAWAQRRRRSEGITIVTGGDAGTAEGDFASSLVWSSRKGQELPMLLTVQNNRWGISTPFEGQHGETHIADRGKAFNMRTKVINGNDPVESFLELRSAMDYVRSETKPFLLEARLSRLYGHSSASGANPVDEPCCLRLFEERLLNWDLLSVSKIREMRENYEIEARAAQEQARLEPPPSPQSIWENVFADGENGDWRKF